MKLKKLMYSAILAATLLFSGVFLLPNTAITAQAKTPGIETMKVTLEWRYTIIDGKLYKRLYNTNTASWVGDLIYVCDYPY